MVLFNMEIQEMLCREVSSALDTTIGVGLRIVYIVFIEGSK